MSTPRRSSRARALPLALLALLALLACAEVTWWDARGSWSGRVTLPGEPSTQQTGSAADPDAGPTEDRVRLCDLTTLDLGLPFVRIERDRPAAIRLRTARPLCEEGRVPITGGQVLVWSSPGTDPNVLSAVPSDAWTVTGEIQVAAYLEQGLPELDAGQTADVERLEGTLSLVATGPSGAAIRIDGGTLQLTVVASRVKLSIS